MKAVWFEKQGPAREVLVEGEMPDPTPEAGQVRVQVRVSGLNPSDTKARGGFGAVRKLEYPRIIPGQDGAGVIDRVGPGVPQSRIGERVWIYEAYRGRPFGTAAGYVAVPSQNAVQLPPSIDFDTGAGLGVPALTAHRCLFADGGIQGRTVLVHGGGGGVGNPAIQLARWAGARVLTTVSRPEQEAAARRAGAHVVINRKRDDVVAAVREATSGQGVDRVVDVDFGQNLQTNLGVLKVGGAISMYSSSPVDSAQFPALQLMVKCIRVDFVLVYTMSQQAHQDAIRDTTACLEAGQYRTEVGARFPLEELAEAHEAQESGTVVGKILVDVSK
ncbi:MAG TPA: NADPH:quinone reductase [Myxococcaceae bacterium]|nr:NADPH:quinone reductase [Myxococcaceae bacterium]